MTINIGPQHPSTHGVLRLLVDLEGENVLRVEPKIGYLHRGLEKMAECRSYLQYLPLVSRIDYLAGFFYSQAFCQAVENLLEIEIPKKAKYLRVLTMEINRITSHLLWLGTYLMDLGATSPFFYTFRERETLLNLLEELTGSRMMYNYYTFGGVLSDVPEGWYEKLEKFLKKFPEKINEYEDLISQNPIFHSRTKGIGIINSEDALNYSLTGANLRASGVNIDFRREQPYLIYNETVFNTPLGKNGDCYDRYIVRINEMRQSVRIIKQCLAWLLRDKNGIINLGINPNAIKPKAGETIVFVESARGLVGCYLKSNGGLNPYRLKWRTPSFYAVQVLPKLTEGVNYADIMAIFGSLDVVLCEVDR